MYIHKLFRVELHTKFTRLFRVYIFNLIYVLFYASFFILPQKQLIQVEVCTKGLVIGSVLCNIFEGIQISTRHKYPFMANA